jgi:hypothetical protein
VPKARLQSHSPENPSSSTTDPHVDVVRAEDIRGGTRESEKHRQALAITDSEALSPRTAAMAEVLSSRPSSSHFQTPMRSPSSNSLFSDNYSLRRNKTSLPDLRLQSPDSSRTSSLRSTPSSSLSLDTKSDASSSDDDGLAVPDCRHARRQKALVSPRTEPAKRLDTTVRLPRSPSPSPVEGLSNSPLTTPDPLHVSEDDTAVRKEPSHHVDYLSYAWREEDIWSSWRHIVEHRSVYGERSRLENASWRTWAKSQFKLRTVTPDSLNW